MTVEASSADASSVEPAQVPSTPFRGLVPYTENDAEFFYGRAAEQEVIEANLVATRLTVLYAGSGVGKTSVLRAGVVRQLRDAARENLARRGRPKLIPVVFSSWRDDPVRGLSFAVHEGVEQVVGESALPTIEHSSSLADTLDAWAEGAEGDLLVVLDQFEEYFLYHPGDDGAGGFAHEFARAVNRPGLRANFLVAIREDALARLDRFKGEIPGLFENYLRLENLDRDAARLAIEMPIEKFNNLVSSNGPRVEIEPELVRDVLDEVQTGRLSFAEAGRGLADEPESNSIEAPFLQLVMTRLWTEEKRAWQPDGGGRMLRAQTLARLGGADRIAKTHLDTVMGTELTSKERTTAARAFHYLVTPSGAKIAHRASDLAEYARLPSSDVESLLKKLSAPDVRVLKPIAPPPGRHGEGRYEIFHDVLAAAILDWRARHARTQRRRSVGVWVVAALLGILLFPIGSLVVATSMRLVRPPFRWRHVLAVVLAWWAAWCVGVGVGIAVGGLLSPTPFENQDDAELLGLWLAAGILGPLTALAVYSRYSRRRQYG